MDIRNAIRPRWNWWSSNKTNIFLYSINWPLIRVACFKPEEQQPINMSTRPEKWWKSFHKIINWCFIFVRFVFYLLWKFHLNLANEKTSAITATEEKKEWLTVFSLLEISQWFSWIFRNFSFQKEKINKKKLLSSNRWRTKFRPSIPWFKFAWRCQWHSPTKSSGNEMCEI